MAKILVGGILQETNTFCVQEETYDSFNQYRGQALMEYLHTSPAKLLEQDGHTVVPAVYASIIPSGPMNAREFQRFLEDFLSYCTDDIDGIWLSMHGAMSVEGIGSAEACLVSRLRQRYGDAMPIFGSFDFHANMCLDLVRQMNYITGYRTAPHTDIYETGCRAVRALIRCLEEKRLPHCRYISIPMVMPGELVITGQWPTCHFLEELEKIQKQWDVLDLSLFCGFAWSDCDRNQMAITLSDDTMDPSMVQQVLDLAGQIWAHRTDFDYGQAIPKEPEDAVPFCRESTAPVIFLSDTGDNVTAGCAGDNALLAGCMIQGGLERALVAGIADRPAVELCFAHPLGDSVRFSLGGTIDPAGSTRIPVTGTLVWKHTFQAEELPTPLRIAVVRCGGVDVLICDQRYSVTTRKRINDTGLRYDDYRIIAVKLGYLFPDFAEQNPCSVLVMTPGNAYQNTAKIPYTHGPSRFYPRDDFTFVPRIELV